jgi:hypothetical protein
MIYLTGPTRALLLWMVHWFVKSEWKRMWKEAVWAQSEVLYWHLSWKTEKNHGHPYPGWPVFGLKFEPGNYQI